MSFDLDGFLPYRLSVAASRISRRFAALYGAEAGLSIPEWRVVVSVPVRARQGNGAGAKGASAMLDQPFALA